VHIGVTYCKKNKYKEHQSGIISRKLTVFFAIFLIFMNYAILTESAIDIN